MEREVVTALRDALKALRRAEKLLEEFNRPALAQAAPALRALEKLAAEHAAISLDLRMARLRIEVMLPPEHDPDKTPVETRRLSAQLAPFKKTEDPEKR